MGSDVSEVQKRPTQALGTKVQVHIYMCTQILRLVDRISSIIPDIEAAQPRCSLGIHALCQLHSANERARELVDNCCNSSKLFLAITGETVKLRFEKTKNELEQSLSQLHSMVPVALASEISEVLVDLRAIRFFVDSCEDLAGKALRAILQQDASPVESVGNSEIELLQLAASMLHIASQKDLLIEKRRIRTLLSGLDEGNSKKKKTLRYLLHSLKKYDKLILQGQPRKSPTQQDEARISGKPDNKSITTNSAALGTRTGHGGFFRSFIPLEEFKCPLSLRLMYDPVIISSGQTFERSYIQKWFDDGHDTCPITKMKLSDLAMTPNTFLRSLISQWSAEHGIEISDASIVASVYGSLETSSNSLHSIASSMKDIDIHIDTSSLSIGSLDSSYTNISHTKLGISFDSIKESSDIESHRFHFYPSIDDIRTQFLSNVRELPWEAQCRAIQDVSTYIIHYNPSCAFVSSENFLDPLIWFLEDALDKRDREAQKAGSQLFLTFLQAKRTKEVHISKNVYTFLSSFLSTEAAAESLAIMEVLSTQVAFSNIVASGVHTSIFRFLDSHKREFQESALKILYNFSSTIDVSTRKLASSWIPILVPFLEDDSSVAGICLGILENLCKFEEARRSIAETPGCIASIVKLLESCSSKDQEHAIRILLDLCSQHEYYCDLVLHEGCIPAVVDISVNGSDKGKGVALELLRQLREIKCREDEHVQELPKLSSNDDSSEGHYVGNSDQKSSKSPGFFRRLFKKK